MSEFMKNVGAKWTTPKWAKNWWKYEKFASHPIFAPESNNIACMSLKCCTLRQISVQYTKESDLLNLQMLSIKKKCTKMHDIGLNHVDG